MFQVIRTCSSNLGNVLFKRDASCFIRHVTKATAIQGHTAALVRGLKTPAI